MPCSTANRWMLMMFVAYAFLLTVRLHFTYSMMVMMAKPLVAEPADRQPCADVEINVGQNSTTEVTRRLLWTPSQQAVTMGAYFFGTLVAVFPGGVYANRQYETTIMLGCMVVTAATLALVPIAAIRFDSWTAVAFLRFLQGCAFGPTAPCGGTMAGKIMPRSKRSLYSTFMFSGTLFGGFVGHAFSALAIPKVSHDGSYFALSAFGFAWTAVWTTMLYVTPYENDEDASSHSLRLFSTPWKVFLRFAPYDSLLFASLGFGYLYSFVTTGIPIYSAKVLGGDAIRNGVQVSIPWLICWVASLLAGTLATSLTSTNTISKTVIRKLYVGIVLILSPLMVLGVLIAECDASWAKFFMKMSVILMCFERSSIRINSLDLCPMYAGSLIALCDVFYSIGNIMDSVVARNLFTDTFNWNLSFLVASSLPITCSIPFIMIGTGKKQCWDQIYRRSSV